MNGVGRGSSYGANYQANSCRSGRRSQAGVKNPQVVVGFRSEWCAKGWVCKYIRLCVS